MPQVKKAAINNRILDAAFALVSEKGYQATSMPDIARHAGTTPGNIYRYYNSKFELFYAVLAPWLNSQIDRLERRIAAMEDGPDKLREILAFMWIELPGADNNFKRTLMEALATKAPEESYSRNLLQRSERRIARLMDACLPPDARCALMPSELAHLVFMAQDGFTLNVQLVDDTDRIEEMIDGIIELLFRGRDAVDAIRVGPANAGTSLSGSG